MKSVPVPQSFASVVSSFVSKDANAEAGHKQRLIGPYRVLNEKCGEGLLYAQPK